MRALTRCIVSIIGLGAALTATACAPTVAWREPVSMSEYPADAMLGANMLVTAQVRMGLPEGWTFKNRKKDDPKGILFWIRDTGANAVMGAYTYQHFDFDVSATRATEFYAKTVMKAGTSRELHRSEIDGNEAHVVVGEKDEHGMEKFSALIYDGLRNLNQISLAADPGFLARSPRVPYTIFSSYKFMPRKLSERRIKGSFSFKCEDGTLDWLDDLTRKWQSKGFSVFGKMGEDSVIINISQVSNPRIQDFYKMERFNPKEIETELHFAGKVYPARAILGESREDKTVIMAFMFKHEGKDYLLSVYRGMRVYRETDAANIHNEVDIRRMLDTNFYFDGAP